MEAQTLSEETLLRMRIAKLYFDGVKERMGKWFITACVFGSVCRNEAHEKSDIDAIFVFKRPTREQRTFINSLEGGLWNGDRQGIINSTFNEHYTTVIKYELEAKYRIHISPYYHYVDNGENYEIWLHPRARLPFKDVVNGALWYPKAFVGL